MKKIALLSLMTIVFIGDLVSQAPNLMSYQAVIWDASGNLVSEKMVNIKISILQGSVSGTSVYSETHKIQTNINGLVSLTIGGGTNATGKITDINWGSGSYFLKTETDPTGGGNYSISGISQLVSVPYSFFSGMTGNIQTTKPGLPGQVLKLDEQGKPFWSGSSYPIVSNQMVSLTSCTASLTVNVSDDGGLPVTSRGVVWSTSPNPTITSSKVIEGNGKGSFSTTLPNLAPNTTYYIRAFATNDVGTGYGSEIKVTTFSGTAIPTLTTSPISDITSTTVKSGGIVTGDCGSVVTARGVVWSTSPDPNISLNTKTTNGTGAGSFTSSLTGLSPNTTYYVRAYAINSAGTGYGNEVTFKTNQTTLPTNGLVAWYPFNGNAKDETVNGFNGEVIGAKLSEDRNGKLNSAYRFRDKEFIDIPNSQDNNLYPMTISLWGKIDSGSTGGSIFNKYISASWNGFAIWSAGTTKEGAIYPFYLNGGQVPNGLIGGYGISEDKFIVRSIPLNNWFHFVMVIDEKGGSLYFNGKFIDKVEWRTPPSSNNNNYTWHIGGRQCRTCPDDWPESVFFRGSIDDVAIWKRSLTESEILKIYKGEKF